jgi:uncharacterized protein
MTFEINDTVKKELLGIARSVIAQNLGIDQPALNGDFTDPVYAKKCGAFVTLHIKGTLRGCIGYIQGILPLRETIEEMAHAAAFRDPRFTPLSVQEFKDIDIEISVLSPIESVVSLEEIVVGRDGIIARKGSRQGLLLPQVATEYGWTREEFISHTCMKAGLQPDAWRDGSVSFEKFSATIFGEI